jgi:DNA-binding NarL/FixJ family response regulator
LIYGFAMERSVTVAVADANSGTDAALVQRLRGMQGISVVGEAEEPGEALRMVREHRPDVIVMDFRQINQNWAEFLGWMTATRPQPGIVVLTTYVTERERSDLMQAGARAILLREIDSRRLVQTIRTVAESVGDQNHNALEEKS